MAARKQRLLRVFDAIGVAVTCAVLLVFAGGSSASATPFASLIMDVRSGEILRSSNSTARIHPASLTKMMTLYIAFEAVENGEISLDTRVRISAHAAAQPPSRLGLRTGQTIAFRYLIRAAALRSANDAAVAIAEALEGSVENFARRMNRTAQAIGMTRTNFVNPHGLTNSRHLSTARDMARLARQLYYDFPQYYNIFSRLRDNAGIATVRNTNRRFLNGYRGADGIKTGFTNAAGYNLAAMAERNGVRILVVVMGARSSNHRFEQVVSLMNRGFRDAPRRATTRRPNRPNYARAPEDSGSGVSAGRVIRLQTAPRASLFPRRRPPQPSEAPPEELLAALRNEIDEVMDDIRTPEPPETSAPDPAAGVVETAQTDTPTDEADPAAVAAIAPEQSPLPAARPDAIVARASALMEVAAGAAPGDVQEQEIAVAEQEGPVRASPDQEPVRDADAAVAALIDSTPLQFEHSSASIANVRVEEGMIVIPGLPPIAPEINGAHDSTLAPVAVAAADASPQPETQPALVVPALEPAEGALTVGEDGRILWRDEELLAALADEDPADPVLVPTIVLTTSGHDEPAAEPPMPEIVTRVSTSGGRVWAVELGLYASRFDAERVLLRLALSESGTLGSGVRRVTARDGRFAAEVLSLTQDSALLACTRLIARDHPCSVIDP